VIIQDKRFRADGGLASAKLGGDILINGTYDPHLRVASQLVRFRLLNASTARAYDVGFADDRAFDLIATAFRPGERALLRSSQPDLGENRLTARFDGGDDTFDLLQVRAAGELRGAAPVPARLARHAPLDPGSATRTRRIEITSSNSIDGKSMDMDRIDQVVTVGTTEVWEVRNGSGSFHNFHVHDVQFEILSYGGAPPPPYLAGPKDTVAIPPGESVRFVARFADYADPSTPYMFHCHLLRHEDNGLMGQFVVVEPGQAALQSPHHQHG
jgi:FtsP/CotA-like multicopper oxidase with cupredoxin domain